MLMTTNIEILPEESAVVTFSGPLTLGTSLQMADSEVRATIASGVRKLIFDMSGVGYVDSAGLGLIVHTYGILNEKKGILRLCGVTPRVMSLLKLTKMDTFLSIDDCRDESLATLN